MPRWLRLPPLYSPAAGTLSRIWGQWRNLARDHVGLGMGLDIHAILHGEVGGIQAASAPSGRKRRSLVGNCTAGEFLL
ncbi:MAG: hypothetical protein KJZ93_00140 [Caldilineaceae bacterium]|nr:hypothetical protein [Caldilineaceae bacterium]